MIMSCLNASYDSAVKLITVQATIDVNEILFLYIRRKFNRILL